jgi:hypothetical protein
MYATISAWCRNRWSSISRAWQAYRFLSVVRLLYFIGVAAVELVVSEASTQTKRKTVLPLPEKRVTGTWPT